MTIGSTLKKIGYIVAFGLGLFAGCNSSSVDQTASNAYSQNFFQGYQQRVKQAKFDKDEESAIELAIEKEFGINLYPPVRVTDSEERKGIEETLNIFGQHLRYVKECNPDLVEPLREMNIVIYPESLEEKLDFGAKITLISMEFRQQFIEDIRYIVHELDHFIIHPRHYRNLQAIVEKYGFRFNDNLKDLDTWKVWENSPYEPRGIFQRPYQSFMKGSYPTDLTAVIREHIYANKEFILDSKRAYDCQREILEYEFNNDILKPVEYEHAIRLLRPQATLCPKNSPEDLAADWGMSWDEIAQFNGIEDIAPIRQRGELIKLIIPISSEVTEGYEWEQYSKILSHVVQKGEILADIAGKYSDIYACVTPEHIKDSNNSLRNKYAGPPAWLADWDIISDSHLREGSCIHFEVRENGQSFYLSGKLIPYMGGIPYKVEAPDLNLEYFSNQILLSVP